MAASEQPRPKVMLRPAARSRVLRIYSATVPFHLRLLLRSRLSPSVRSYLARRLTVAGPITAVADRIAALPARARYAPMMRSGEYALAHNDHGIVPARVTVNLSPLTARRETVDAVSAMLTDAGVDFFCVRPFHDLTAALAVSEADRKTVMRALRESAKRTPGFVADVVDRRAGPLRRASGRRTMRRLARATTIRFVNFFADPTGSLVVGEAAGCDIEFWRASEGRLTSPRPNRVTDVVRADGPTVTAAESTFTRLVAANSPRQRTYRTRPEMLGELVDDVPFPIDVVYTWVDGADPGWRARRDAVRGLVTEELNDLSANESRFVSRDELRYSMRSLHLFAPWVRHIYLVTDDQVPAWLDTSHAGVTVVSHKELFGTRGRLPTFNSHAIETQLHHVDGLSDHFLYFNDDVLLGRPVTPQAFFQPNGLSKVFLSRAKVDLGEVDVEADIPSTAAGKNNRVLISELSGRHLTYKMKHVPHALRRDVLAELESRFADRVTETAGHQFRHPGDISMTSSLHQYYAMLTNRAVIDDIAYMYVDLAAADAPGLLRLALAKRNFDVFCLNDTDSDPEAMRRQQKIMHEFLTAYFPVPAPWELLDPRGVA